MKKLYNPLATGGAPVFTETLNNTELELWAAVEGILKHLDPTAIYPAALRAAPATNYISTGIIVSGGDVTDNTTDWDLAAGVAYFPVAGRFARFAAEATIANGDYAMITLDSPVTTQKAFFDAANKDYFVEYGASVATLTPPAAAPGVEYVSVRKAAALSGYPNSLMGHPYFGNLMGELSFGVMGGVRNTLTPLNSWTVVSSNAYYRKIGGVVWINIHASNAASATNDIFAQLPSGYRPGPATLLAVSVAWANTSGTLYPVHVNGATGDISIAGGAGQGAEGGGYQMHFSFLEASFNQ